MRKQRSYNLSDSKDPRVSNRRAVITRVFLNPVRFHSKANPGGLQRGEKQKPWSSGSWGEWYVSNEREKNVWNNHEFLFTFLVKVQLPGSGTPRVVACRGRSGAPGPASHRRRTNKGTRFSTESREDDSGHSIVTEEHHDTTYTFSRHAIRSNYMDKSIEAKKKVSDHDFDEFHQLLS